MNRRDAVYQLAAVQLGLLGLAMAPARAQGYPDGPVRIVIGVPPGAGPDVEARAFAAALQLELGQPVVVENKPGFTGLLAKDAVAKAAPDGYTLGAGNPSNLTSNPRLVDRPPFNVDKDIAPIIRFIEHPWLLYINAKLPASNLAEFVEMAKASPGRISYASAGIGSFPHLTAEWFQKLAGIRLNHIPYSGGNHWQSDLLASTGRTSMLPEVPTFAQAGYPEYSARAWAGLVAPAATPGPVIERLAQASARAVQRAEFREFVKNFGGVTGGGTPQDFAKFLSNERGRLQALIVENNIRLE